MPDRRWLFLPLAFLAASIANAAQPEIKSQEVFAPYWTSEPGWDTELQLKNNLAAGSLTVTPVLRLSSSQEIVLDPVSIDANDTTHVWVNLGLLKQSPDRLGQPGSYGSVVFRFAAANARNLYAVSIPQLHGTSIEFLSEAQPVPDFALLPRAAGSGSQEGIWTQPGAHENDLLIVSDSSEKPLTAKLWLSDAAGKRWSENLNLAAHQTRRIDFRELLLASHLSGSYGGIGIEVPAYAGALHAIHIVYDEQTQTARLLKMVSRDPAATLAERIPRRDHRPWTAWATMVPLQNPDAILGLPPGTKLQPTVFVRNVTAKPIAVSLALTWHGEAEGSDGSAKFGDVQLAAYETRQIPAPSGQKSGIPETAAWATINLSSPSSPDDVVAFASSHDETGRYGTDVAFTDAIGSHFVGGEWRADATHDAMMAVINTGAVVSKARVTLRYDKGEKKYEMERALQSGEQMWIRLGDLIQRRVPDTNGNALPPNMEHASFEVEDLNRHSGSLLVSTASVDNSWGRHLRHETAECCGINVPARFSPSFFDVPPDDLWNPFLTVANDACTGGQDEIDMLNFWTTNPSIAQMTSSGVKGLAVGSTTGEGESEFLWVGAGNNCVLKQVTPTAPIDVGIKITAINPDLIMIGSTSQQIEIDGYGFGSSPVVHLPPGFTKTGQASQDTKIVLSGVSIPYTATIGNNNFTVTGPTGTSPAYGFTVNGPNKMVVQSDAIGPCQGSSYQCRIVNYTVKNYDGTLAANIPIAENISYSGYNCKQTDPGHNWSHCDGTAHTDGGGNFGDQWGMYTGFTPSGCGVNITDHWQWCGPTGNNPTAGITFGTITGWTHTSNVDINGYINPPTVIPQGTIFAP